MSVSPRGAEGERLSQFPNSAVFITAMNVLQHSNFCPDRLLANDNYLLDPNTSRCPSLNSKRSRLFSHKVTPITLDYFLVDLPGREILVIKPAVEMPDQPELDPAVDPRIAVGCQPGCEQIDVPR